jgi:drug/metabolite transporter (DMT)-like permease
VTISPQARPLDTLAITLIVALCLCWGFDQAAIKLALHDIPPLIQSTARSVLGALLVGAWAQLRGIALFKRDGTLLAGSAAGVLFALQFLLSCRGLVWTTATRAILFVYLAPFFVVLSSRWLVPGDRFYGLQWFGLFLSFVGVVVAFGLPTPSADPHQMLGDIMMVGAAAAWAATTLVIKVSALNHVSAEKTILYQLVISAPLLAGASVVFGESVSATPSALSLGALAYQAVWVVSVTYVAWFAMIVRYSASRLSAFTFLTPLFGVAAGHFVLNEPLTAPFVLAVGLVTVGLVFVNRRS